MKDLLVHPKTAERLEAIVKNAPHGLLITGTTGSGKATLAKHIASEVLEAKIEGHPYVLIVDPDEPSIKIEDIRSAKNFLKLKVPSARVGVNRVLIILDADRMTSDAQNNLLKTLEEPPEGTMLILTAESTQNLLSTVVSRSQELAVLPVSLDQATKYFDQKGISTAKLSNAYALSMGQAGLLNALLADEEHVLREQVEFAKSILASPAGQRLKHVDGLSKDKPRIKLLLNAFTRIAHAALSSSGKQNKDVAVRQWHTRQKLFLESVEDFNKNANTKLLLTNLFINL